LSSTTGQKAETFGIFSDSDQELHQDLQKVNLPHLVEKIGGFDVEKDWDDVLFIWRKTFR
jgi:ABC-type uncharacterized transport system fused permease/ATPase subunit